MQLPKRKSLSLPDEHPDAVVYLSSLGLEKLKDQIRRLKEYDEPIAIKDVSEAVQKGDLSENAEYQEARARLTRTQNRVVRLEERLKRVVVIENEEGSDAINIGSVVYVETPDGSRKQFEIVGPSETNPARGCISYLSPIGSALMKHAKGDEVSIEINGKVTRYVIVGVE
ncbi:MAG: GreA/GreB family elongation factor [Patescibacteria group bacterium]